MRLSIIIPTFNVEKYIEKCLLSCVNQDIPSSSYEIILVNDGSKDNSLQIAESITDKYSNIRIISQDNQGLSAARNTGLRHAQGEYIWFIDSDDWIVENCLSGLISYCKDIDVLCLGYTISFEDGKPSKIVMPPKSSELIGKKHLCTMQFCVPAQFYIYRREFLYSNGLSFYEGILHEDMEFTPRMLYLANDIKIYPNSVYNYFIRANSITTTVNSKKSFDLIKVAKSLHNFSINHDVDNETKHAFSYYISIDINNALSLAAGYSLEEKMKIKEKLYKNKIIFRHLIDSPTIKNKIEGILFSLMPKHCLAIYSFLSKMK